MSGIAALIHFDGRPADRAILEAMTGAMDYRGPDGTAHTVENGAGIGHCALNTNAEAKESRQPISSESSGLTVTMDGYLSNWEELREELIQSGAKLRDRSDAELVLRAFETWGEALVDHLDGEYAIVVWDSRRQRVHCISDPIGMRPMHYSWDGATLVVASDIKPVVAALTALGRPPSPNNAFLAELASAAWFSMDETIWSSIMRPEPAHIISFEAGRDPHKREYWTINLDSRIRHASDEDYFAEYRHVYSECVRRAARADGPIGCDVSGGLDSSAVFAMACKLQREGALLAPDVRGYTMRAPDGSEADEIEYALAVGAHVGKTIHEAPMFLPELEWFQKKLQRDANLPPFPNTAIIRNHDLAMAADGCRVALNGQGGDHWLGGSSRYYEEQVRHSEWGAMARSFQADSATYGWRKPAFNLVRQAAAAILPAGIKRPFKSVLGWNDAPYFHEPAPYLSETMKREFVSRRERYDASRPAEPKLRFAMETLRYPFDRYLVTQHDRQLAQAGLESRHPMFSRRFVEHMVAVPAAMRYRGSKVRYIHRKALKSILPDKVLSRDDEAGFDMAMNKHLPQIVQYLGEHASIVDDDLFDTSELRIFMEFCCNASFEGIERWQLWNTYLAYVFRIIADSIVSRQHTEKRL
ncbi:MAG: asparagine synthase-related protein [Alteraurantiacibacter sp.]